MKNHQLHPRLQFTTVREVLAWASETHKDKTAYSYREKASDREILKVSFEKLHRDATALASALTSMGVQGKHCAVVGKLSYHWALVYFAVLSAGGVLMPLDKDWKPEDLAHTAGEGEAKFLFCDKENQEAAETIFDRADLAHSPIWLNACGEGSLEELLSHGKANPVTLPAIDPIAPALLVYTSGTTGAGKGVLLTQEAIISNITAALPYIDYSEKTVGVLPPHHTYGSTVMFLGHTIIGSEVYISAGLRHIQRELKEQKPGHLVLVPLYLETFYRKILANAKEQKKEKLLFSMIKVSNALRKMGIDLRKKLFASVREAFGGEIKTVISGGAPINREILAFFEALGISTLNGYGITECAPLIAVNRSRYVVPDSVGHVIDVDTVKIQDPDANGEGEILVKGPNVMLGYYKNPAATAEAIDSEGYFHTGDYGRLNEEGILFITGRKKNLIILSNGKNVYPEEMENELIALPGVLEVVVYQGKSKRGEAHDAIVAEIYPDPEYCKKNGVEDPTAFLKAHVDAYNRTATPYKRIAKLKVRRTEFPKNTLRKIKRFELDTSID